MFEFTQEQSILRHAITEAYRKDEQTAIECILSQVKIDDEVFVQTQTLARELMNEVRINRSKVNGVDTLMHEFSLSTEEGVALMCVVEALLRIPDKATQEKFLRDKMGMGNWKSHVQKKGSFFSNALSWGLMLTGKLTSAYSQEGLMGALGRVLAKGGEPLVRQGVGFSMQVLGKQFIVGQTVEEALARDKRAQKTDYLFSYAMLKGSALTQKEADRNFGDYVSILNEVGKDAKGSVYENNDISIKLSAIHPRFCRSKKARVMTELLPRLKELFLMAQEFNVGLSIAAESADKLELSLDVIEAIATDPQLADFDGIGITVQAYQKRSLAVIDYLGDLAKRTNHTFMIRLVKGDYWEGEIKQTQLDGQTDYPVFTRKTNTDVSYLACALRLLRASDRVFPQFATHNVYMIALLTCLAKGKSVEFQCLFGVDESLYDQISGSDYVNHRCRVYAPIGSYQTLSPYLVRRLLESGSSSSFIHQISDENLDLETLLANPLLAAAKNEGLPHKALILSRTVRAQEYINSKKIDLSNEHQLNLLQMNFNHIADKQIMARSLFAEGVVENNSEEETWLEICNPASNERIVGQVSFLSSDQPVRQAIGVAFDYQKNWQQIPFEERAAQLSNFVSLLEKHRTALMMLAINEVGLSLSGANNEFKKVIDHCRYYIRQVSQSYRDCFDTPLGVVVCVGSWSSPLAMFASQFIVPLLTGSTVLLKPAKEASLMAYYVVTLLYEAGIPKEACQLLLGEDDVLLDSLTTDEKVGGVVFVGSKARARKISKSMAKRGDLIPFLAEVGGQNAMIVDSSASVEQVVTDVLYSTFNFSGQYNSALNVLCVQEEIADAVVDSLKGAMVQLKLGDPCYLDTDIGPVVNVQAQVRLLKYIESTKAHVKSYHENELPDDYGKGTYVVPILLELDNVKDLKEKVFGPVLHVVRFKFDELEDLLVQLNEKEYALTHSIHSRVDETIQTVCANIDAGDIYVNRNMLDTAIGFHSFGGLGFNGAYANMGMPFYIAQFYKENKWQLNFEKLTGGEVAPQLQVLSDNLSECAFLSEDCRKDIRGCIVEAMRFPLLGANLALPSFVGESNTLYVRSRKNILIHSDTFDLKLLEAFVSVVAAGATVWVVKGSPLAAFNQYMPEVVQVVDDILTAPAYLWLALSTVPTEIKTKLAEQDRRKLTSIIEVEGKVNLLQLFSYSCVTVNTSAVGGDAQLLVLPEN